MAVGSFVFILFCSIVDIRAEEIKCSAVGECANSIISCIDNSSECEVTCAGNGCRNTTINCLAGHNCTIRTGGSEAAQYAVINGHRATKLDVFTGASGARQLQSAIINCPKNNHCFVDCLGDVNMCQNLRINADSSHSLWLACAETNDCCNNMDVYCPSTHLGSQFCVIDGQKSTSGMSDINIYSKLGFDAIQIYDPVVNQQNFGIIHCLDGYTTSCAIDTSVEGNHMQCAGGRTPCDSPTAYPTESPTVDPTSSPTRVPTEYPTKYPTKTPSFHPTSNPTQSPFATAVIRISTTQSRENDFKITFTIGEKVEVDEIDDVVEKALIAFPDIEITSTTIQNDGGVIVILRSSDSNLNAEIIEREVEEELNTEYGTNIDVNVETNAFENNESETSLFTDFLQYEIFIILLLVIIVLLLAICIIGILLKRKYKSKTNEPQFGKAQSQMGLIENNRKPTLTKQQTGESGTMIEDVHVDTEIVDTPGVVPEEDPNDLPDEEIEKAGSDSESNEEIYKHEYGHVKGMSSITSKGGSIDELYRKATITATAGAKNDS